MISMASSKLSTGMIGRMGPNISLKPDVRTTKYVWGDLSHSAISGSSGATPRTIVGAMYLVGESVSPPRTMIPLVLSNNPLTRVKYALVGARARDRFAAPSGKNSEILTHRQSSWSGCDERTVNLHFVHRSNERLFAISRHQHVLWGSASLSRRVIVPNLGKAEGPAYLTAV